VERHIGKVIRFSDIRGFGFIESESGKSVFVHFSDIRGDGFRSLSKGQIVEYTIAENEKGYWLKM
jgi:CspA family cold shock protein